MKDIIVSPKDGDTFLKGNFQFDTMGKVIFVPNENGSWNLATKYEEEI